MLFKKPAGPISWLLVFLGNPGAKYENTRHNAGFMAADTLAHITGVRINRLRFKSLTAECRIGDQRVFLMKPQTYMNLSGDAVKQAADFYKLSSRRVLAVSDDITLPLGKLRVRQSGSSGGHNGLKNIIERLGTEDFPRIRIGVGAPPHPDYDVTDWVISSFSGKEADIIRVSRELAAAAIQCILLEGFDRAMSKYN